MSEAISEIVLNNLVDIIVGIFTVVTGYIILPFIKTELIPWLKEKRLYEIVRKCVEAAEKLAETGQIQKVDKKMYVIGRLELQGITVDGRLDTLIEAAVKELDNIESAVYDTITKD